MYAVSARDAFAENAHACRCLKGTQVHRLFGSTYYQRGLLLSAVRVVAFRLACERWAFDLPSLLNRFWLLLPFLASQLAVADDQRSTDSPVASFQLHQMRHSVFRGSDGAPSDVTDIAQAADGILWISSGSGLYRFDGARFDASVSQRLPSPSVRAIMAEPDGALWIGYTFGGASVLRNGKVSDVSAGIPSGSVTQFLRLPNGSLWVSTSSGLARRQGDRWQVVNSASGYSGESPNWMAVVNGRLMILTPTATYSYTGEAGHFERRPAEVGEAARFGIPESSKWRPDPEPDGIRVFPKTAVRDHSGALWFSSLVADRPVLKRISFGTDVPGILSQDALTTDTGLSGVVQAIMEDRESNVWVGTSGGLERFFVPRLKAVNFPSPAYNTLLIPGENGEVWVGRARFPTVRLTPIPQAIPGLGDSLQAAFRTEDGSLWVGGDPGLLRYAHGAVLQKLSLPKPLTVPEANFQAIAVAADGSLWISIAGSGLFRWDGESWSDPALRYSLPGGPAIRLRMDAQRRLWAGYPANRIAVLEGSHTKVYTSADGLQIGNVLSIEVKDSHAWVGGDRGVALLASDHFIPLRGKDNKDFQITSGIIETEDGDLWLNAAEGIYRIAAADVRAMLKGSVTPVAYETFDALDGLDSPVNMIRPGPSMLESPDGRLWFSRREGVWFIDPHEILRNPIAPITVIERLTSRGSDYDLSSGIRLPSGTHSLAISYTAASLRKPERTRFRYRLQGADDGWQDVGARRQAYYTNLGPGTYEFQVMAANEDGVWSTNHPALKFVIQPAFFERLTFKVAVALLALLMIGALFMFRLEMLKRTYRRRIEAHHAERERIAREIHDTLLQGVQALFFRLRLWAEDLDIPAAQRAEMAEVSQQTKAIVIESRERIVKMRRVDAEPSELIDALAAIGHHASNGQVPGLDIRVAGNAKPLTAFAKEQALDIAGEAIRNAYSHAQAARVTVTVEYLNRSLLVVVSDDGIGFNDNERDRSTPGHFGLIGMRERARALKARLTIRSAINEGTRIELVVPAGIAFQGALKWP
jgi:signal transduction histidine kinase